jgi:regulation of enolase protein 1 (concanavalin A-like superfamily)
VGDGAALETNALQAAINACTSGGEVFIPAGTYKTTTLMLKSNMLLKIDSGATLQASLIASDWTAAGSGPILTGTGLKNISIIGKGMIDGGGLVYYVNGSTVSGSKPQKIIVILQCTNVTVTGIRLQNSVVQTFELTQCDTALIDGVIIRNRDRTYGSGTDGIDVSGRYLTIQNVDIETGDDAFCIKPQGEDIYTPARASHDITVQNSILASTCHTLKFGTKTIDELYNVKFIHNTINKHSGSPGTGGNWDDMASGVCEVAISLEANNGSNIHDVLVDDIHITRCGIPIWLEIQKSSGDFFGHLDNITVSNIVCDSSEMTSNINVQPGVRFKNITLKNLTIHNYETWTGTASPLWLDGISYQYGFKIGSTIARMPAYGIFARCVSGLNLTGTNNFYDDGHSGRPATKYEDVTFAGTPDFSISATSSSGAVVKGDSTTYTIKVDTISGFNGNVNFTVSGLPAGMTYAFSPNPKIGYGITTLTIKADTSTLLGNSQLTITGTSDTLVRTAQVMLAVNGSSVGDFIDRDIGAVGVAGSASFDGTTWKIIGGGTDVANTSDQFHYAYKPYSGDWTILAHVAYQQNTNSWSKSGVMIRQSTDSSSAFVFVMCTPSTTKGMNMQSRAITGVTHVSQSQIKTACAPYWVELVRSGNTFTGYMSANGSTWVLMGSVSITMTDSVLIGLAVCAHLNSATCETWFDNVSIKPTAITSVNDKAGAAAVTAYELAQNYPNPFNPSTSISYQLPKAGFVKLTVFDVLGREIAVLVNGMQSAGGHQATFDAKALSSGMYFYRLSTDNFAQVKKMLLVK